MITGGKEEELNLKEEAFSAWSCRGAASRTKTFIKCIIKKPKLHFSPPCPPRDASPLCWPIVELARTLTLSSKTPL